MLLLHCFMLKTSITKDWLIFIFIQKNMGLCCDLNGKEIKKKEGIYVYI